MSSFRPYLEAVFNALECSENDYEALFALCLLYALGHNEGRNFILLLYIYHLVCSVLAVVDNSF